MKVTRSDCPLKISRLAQSLMLIVFVALALREGYEWNYLRTHSRQALSAVPFLLEPGNIAYSIASGKGFSSPLRVESGPTAWMTPAYPLLLAALFRVFGTYTFVAYVAASSLNILFSSATCIPIFFAGKRMAGISAGAAAAWLWAIFPNAWIIPVESMWDASLSAPFGALILWATPVVADSRRLRDWCGYGLLWGAALMTNAALVVTLPLLLIWMGYRARGVRLPLQAAGVVVLCCVPWTVRNAAVMHAFVPLRSVLGVSLWLGTIDPDLGRAPRSYHPIADTGERNAFVEMGELNYMREKEKLAIDFIVAHPATEVRLSAQRFVGFWSGGSVHPIDDFRAAGSLWFRWVLGFNVLLTVGGLVGAVKLVLARNFVAVPALIFVVVAPVAYYVTLESARYRHPIDPAVMMLAACCWPLMKKDER